MAKYFGKITIFFCLFVFLFVSCKKSQEKREIQGLGARLQKSRLLYWAYIYGATLPSFTKTYLEKVNAAYDFFSITGLRLTKSGVVRGKDKFFRGLQAKGIELKKVFPLLTPDSILHANGLLKSRTAQERVISSLLQLVEKYDLPGLQVDFEGLPISLAPAFEQFLQDLKLALNQKGKRLSMAMFPQIEFPESLAALHTFRSYREAVDEVVLMAYDYSQKKEGPVTSVAWSEENIQFLLHHLSPGQIYLGIPLYGYAYPRRKKGKIRVVSQKYAEKLRQKNVLHRHDSGCMLLETTTSTIYYPDAILLRRLLGLAHKYSLQGIAFWRLGFEARYLYPELRKERVY
ncbi:MAG: glycosyl hydrolase family 18 protein [Spirochaetota bacterium]